MTLLGGLVWEIKAAFKFNDAPVVIISGNHRLIFASEAF